MSNPMKDYVDNFRANLPSGVTFESGIARYFFNGKRFISEWDVERYREYLIKFGYSVSTPFAFADLYASGEDGFIYDPSQSGLTDGDPVTGATDRINSNDATQATAANQPVYDLTDGVHSFRANGIDEWLRIPNFPIGSDFTAIFSLKNSVQETGAGSILRPLFAAADEDSTGATAGYYTMSFLDDGGAHLAINGENINAAFTSDGSDIVLTFRKEGTSAKIFLDGVEIASGTLSTTSGFGTGDYALFGNPPKFVDNRAAKTDLYHVMIIDRALTAQEQSDAETLSAEFAESAGPDPLAPVYTFSGLSNNTLFANAEDSDSSTLDLYHTLDTADIGDVPTPSQVENGLDHTGSAAQVAEGPETVSTGVVNFSLPLSGEPEGEYVLRGIAKDSDGNYSAVQSLALTIDIPFVDDFNRADEALSASANWVQTTSDADGDMEIISNQLNYVQNAANVRVRHRTVEEKPADQFIKFDVVESDDGGSFSMEVEFFLRRAVGETTGGYRLLFDPTDGAQGRVFIENLSGGSVSVAGRPFSGDEWAFEAQGDEIRVKRNGAVILSTTDTTYTTGGQAHIGYFFGPTGPTFILDNFEFGAL